MKDHLVHVHSQYIAFKVAQEEAEQNRNVATIQVDWSKNRKLTQCGEEKGAYNYEDHVSLHPIYIWHAKDQFSKVAMGNTTSHTAPAVMSSLLPLLIELEMSGVKHVNVISDSPTSQCRNKGMFWLVKTFCKEFSITVKWIYLESGHGKGIPDGIGATAKKAIENLMLSNPSIPVYSVENLLKNGLQEAVPSIGLYTYEEEDIINFRNPIPKLKPMKGTMKLHEVEEILQQQEFTLMIKDKSTDATAQKVSLELEGLKSVDREMKAVTTQTL